MEWENFMNFIKQHRRHKGLKGRVTRQQHPLTGETPVSVPCSLSPAPEGQRDVALVPGTGG